MEVAACAISPTPASSGASWGATAALSTASETSPLATCAWVRGDADGVAVAGPWSGPTRATLGSPNCKLSSNAVVPCLETAPRPRPDRSLAIISINPRFYGPQRSRAGLSHPAFLRARGHVLEIVAPDAVFSAQPPLLTVAQ